MINPTNNNHPTLKFFLDKSNVEKINKGDMIYQSMMFEEPSPEREREVINILAEKIVGSELETLLSILVDGLRPLSIMGHIYLLVVNPFLWFFGLDVSEFALFLRDPSFLERLSIKINELKEEKNNSDWKEEAKEERPLREKIFFGLFKKKDESENKK